LTETEDDSDICHKWQVYIAPENNSGTNDKELESVIESVEFQLHRTFSPSVIVVTKAPFRITRYGWGTFPVHATVHWKPELQAPPTKLSHNLNFTQPNSFECVKLNEN